MRTGKRIGHRSGFRVRIGLLLLFFIGFHPYPVVAEAVWSTVIKVWDGDTVELADHRTIRYIGIDTPEICHGNRPSEPFSQVAKRMNADLVLQKRVRVEYDQNIKDRYGRWLAYLFLEDGSFVNEALVRRGMAYVLPTFPNDKYRRTLLDAQNRAMDDTAGIWAILLQTETTYIGNRHSGRFHLQDCPSARAISPTHRLTLPSKEMAFRQGYAPCRRCGIKIWK